MTDTGIVSSSAPGPAHAARGRGRPRTLPTPSEVLDLVVPGLRNSNSSPDTSTSTRPARPFPLPPSLAHALSHLLAVPPSERARLTPTQQVFGPWSAFADAMHRAYLAAGGRDADGLHRRATDPAALALLFRVAGRDMPAPLRYDRTAPEYVRLVTDASLQVEHAVWGLTLPEELGEDGHACSDSNPRSRGDADATDSLRRPSVSPHLPPDMLPDIPRNHRSAASHNLTVFRSDVSEDVPIQGDRSGLSSLASSRPLEDDRVQTHRGKRQRMRTRVVLNWWERESTLDDGNMRCESRQQRDSPLSGNRYERDPAAQQSPLPSPVRSAKSPTETESVVKSAFSDDVRGAPAATRNEMLGGRVPKARTTSSWAAKNTIPNGSHVGNGHIPNPKGHIPNGHNLNSRTVDRPMAIPDAHANHRAVVRLTHVSASDGSPASALAQDLARREHAVALRERAVAEREHALGKNEDEAARFFTTRYAKLQAIDAALLAAQKRDTQRGAALDARAGQVLAHERAAETREAAFARREAHLHSREGRWRDCEADLATRRAVLAAAEAEVGATSGPHWQPSRAATAL